MKGQGAESFPPRIIMTHQENHGRQLDYGRGALCMPGGGYEIGGNIFEDEVRSNSSSAGGSVVVKTLQLFDIFPSSTALKSPGMEANLRFPFTSVQWKEFERQAMIFKYLVASVPVPPELLFPISSNSPAAASDPYASLNRGAIFNLRNSKNGDLEPGRCKRTDGKKWRCAKDVAPNQKYCERHLHRGRPRSRKHVEVKTNASFNTNTQAKNAASRRILPSTENPPPFYPKTGLNISTPSYEELSRNLDLITEAEMAAMCGADPQRQHLVDTDLENGGSIYVQNPSLNMFPYTDFIVPDNDVHLSDGDQIYVDSFLNPDLISSDRNSWVETSARFIDAWSNNRANTESSVSLDQWNISPSSLTLSMAMTAGNRLDRGMKIIEVGVGSEDCNDLKREDSGRPGPISWTSFAQGGPLAEVLGPGSVSLQGSDAASPYNSISPSATTVSSPSGVLHRTLFSHSDSSVCNSPSLGAQTGLSDAAVFPWLN